MALAVADISNYQGTGWRPASNEKIVFVLATDGHTWFNKDHDDQVAMLRSLKRRVGHYHYLEPGNIQAQVDWFWQHAKPKAGDAVIVDWEQAGTSNADKDQFLTLLDAKIPRTKILKRRKNQRLLYCNTNYWLNYDRTSMVGEGLWIARYNASDPGIQHPWEFWQYTDTPYDRSHSTFATLKAYDAWANPGDGTTPAPAPAPVPTITVPVYPSLDAIRTKYGQWGPSWSWNKGKNPAHPTWGQHGGDDWHRNAGLAEIGDPVYAVADGTIIYAGDARKDGGQGWGPDFGIHTLLQWDTGGRTSVDGHMNELTVKTGQKVKAGDQIGKKGMTGNVTGPHVHHEDHLGTRWTDTRVKPIYPGIKQPAPTPAPSKGSLIMAAPDKYQHHADQPVPKSNNWTAVDVDGSQPGKKGVTHGPATVQLVAQITPTVDVWARFATFDWKQGASKLIDARPKVLIPAGGGEVSLYDHIGGPGKGYSQRIVRLQVCAPDGATISDLIITAGKEA